MLIYTLVVTYNGEQCITKCLQSLSESTIQSKVLVIDNASTDNTLNLIKDQFPEVRLIPQTENLGFGAANNVGLKLALEEGVDYVFLLNQDAFVEADCMRNLLNLALLNLDYGIISPMQLYKKGILDKNFNLYLQNGISKYGAAEGIQQVDFVNAAAWLIPMSVIRKAGGFSPLFYHYGEDNNFCDRVLFYKYKIGVDIQTTVYHERHQHPIIKGSYFTYLLNRFQLKSLIYISDPGSRFLNSVRKLSQEILSVPVSGKIRGTIYRMVIFKLIIIYIFRNWNKIAYYKKFSLEDRAFIKNITR